MGNLREQLAKQLGISVEEFEARIAEKKKREQVEARHAAEQKAASEHGTKAPGYPEARLLPLSEAREILATIPQPPANPSVDGVFDPETFTLPSVQLIDHSLVTDELRLAAEGSNLIIRGDLKVDGILKQDFRAGHLLVMGDLDAGHIVTTSEIACLGNLRVGGLLYGNCNY